MDRGSHTSHPPSVRDDNSLKVIAGSVSIGLARDPRSLKTSYHREFEFLLSHLCNGSRITHFPPTFRPR